MRLPALLLTIAAGASACQAKHGGSKAPQDALSEPPPPSPAGAQPATPPPTGTATPAAVAATLPPGEPAATAANPVQVAWLGTAGLFVTDGKTSFLIDPFVSRYGLARVLTRLALTPQTDLVKEWIKKLGVPPGTPVIVTHSHYDHVLDAPSFAQELGGKLIGSSSTLNVGLGAGMKSDMLATVRAGEVVTLGDFKIRFMKSCHGPQFAGLELWTGDITAPLAQPTGAAHYKVGDHVSLAVEHPKGTFYHQSSACLEPGMYEGVHASTLFLGISARSSTQELVDPALQGTGARRLVPIHWDDFFEPLSEGPEPVTGVDMDEFYETMRLKHPETQVKTLGYAESITL